MLLLAPLHVSSPPGNPAKSVKSTTAVSAFLYHLLCGKGSSRADTPAQSPGTGFGLCYLNCSERHISMQDPFPKEDHTTLITYSVDHSSSDC